MIKSLFGKGHIFRKITASIFSTQFFSDIKYDKFRYIFEIIFLTIIIFDREKDNHLWELVLSSFLQGYPSLFNSFLSFIFFYYLVAVPSLFVLHSQKTRVVYKLIKLPNNQIRKFLKRSQARPVESGDQGFRLTYQIKFALKYCKYMYNKKEIRLLGGVNEAASGLVSPCGWPIVPLAQSLRHYVNTIIKF